MIRSANLGFPRIGARRELKRAVEAYWTGDIDVASLTATGAELRARHWKLQRDAGIEVIPSNDFSFYDQVLDMSVTIGCIPPRFRVGAAGADLDVYFAMARGTDDAPAMEMTKWFDTNYHYIVPEFLREQEFTLQSTKAVDEFLEAKSLGFVTRPVLLGPVTYLSLGKSKDAGLDSLSLLDRLLPVYKSLIDKLHAAGARWIQIDEPILALDLNDRQCDALRSAYRLLNASGADIMLATYFESLRDNLGVAVSLQTRGLHIDLVRGREQLDRTLAVLADSATSGQDTVLSLGVVDGRNIWRSDLDNCLTVVEKAARALGTDRIEIAPSCSLIHVPVDLQVEQTLDAELKSWMAFGKQKLEEIAALSRAMQDGRDAAADAFAASSEAARSRHASPRIHNDGVKTRVAGIKQADLLRRSDFQTRRVAQHRRMTLPEFPTTTIGSFPQTEKVRKARAAFRRGDMDRGDYEAFLEDEIKAAVEKQEALGLDVLVHGEFERNDMVEYFGEQLDGFAITKHGWVQSYGSRYVKPPVVFGDVSRPGPMTVKWSAYAQSVTDRPMKGMLTGPVTILQWSFVRNDQPRMETCRQIALAIRDEVLDLEKADIRAIQIDEPALREGLPLRMNDRNPWLRQAVDCFRLAAAGVCDDTQIHSHMCYSEFNDIMASIVALDADVISIENSRSDMELLSAFVDFRYPNEIGPGLWDIHSPRVPSVDEMKKLLCEAASVISRDKLWVNPDCGLKTRGWPEVERSISNMVAAAVSLRA
ncbi:MAG: 5-methyltetrahydropteroyltriglutamate--homocysteine S-methyltransferase [Woeseia sp.]